MKGWFKERTRHSLAARGLPTGRYKSKYFQKGKLDTVTIQGEEFPQIPLKGRQKEKERLAEQKGSEAKELLSDVRKAGVPVEQALGEKGEEARRRTVEEARGLLRERGKFKEDVEESIRKERPLNVAVAEAQRGIPTSALEILAKKQITGPEGGVRKITSDEEETLRSALETFAVQRAKAGVKVSEGVLSQLSREARGTVKSLAEEKRLEAESPFKKGLRDFERQATVGALEAPVEGIKKEAEIFEAGRRGPSKPFPGGPGSEQDFPGAFDRGVAGEVPKLPFFTQNALIGDEEQGMLRTPKVPRLRESITGAVGVSKEEKRNPADVVVDKAENLFRAKDDLAKVDLSGFDTGTKAFKKGNREDLIDAITSLKSEEGKLRDRWNAVEQVHAQSLAENVQSAAFEKSGENPFFNAFSSGASRVEKATDRINEVKESLKKANDKVFARRRMLEFRLQRLDAQVPPEKGAPEKVTRFDREPTVFPGVGEMIDSVENPVTKVENPVIGNEE